MTEKVCLLDETANNQEREYIQSSSTRFVFIAFLIILITLLYFSQSIENVGGNSKLLQYSSFNFITKPWEFFSNVNDSKGAFLSYNSRVKQNIMKALASEEIMSGAVTPLRDIRRNYMIAPAVRLSLCPISKSMSTVAMNMFCYLYNPDDFVQRNESFSSSSWRGRLCAFKNELEGVLDKNHGLGNFIDYAITIIREPFSRFISGYVDKCVNKQWNCFNCEKEDMLCVLTELKKVLSSGLSQEEFQKKKNFVLIRHLAPQTWYCDMRYYFKKMLFVKFGSGTDHQRMVTDLSIALEISQVPHQRIDYIRNELNKEERTNHTTEGSEYKKKIITEFASRSDWKELFWSIFKNDYWIFEFDVPK